MWNIEVLIFLWIYSFLDKNNLYKNKKPEISKKNNKSKIFSGWEIQNQKINNNLYFF